MALGKDSPHLVGLEVMAMLVSINSAVEHTLIYA